MNKLFDKTDIKGINLANRFVRSATWEGMATQEGDVTPQLIRHMTELAKGECGLIISGHAYVSKEGQTSFKQLGIDRDELVPGLRKITDEIHKYDSKVIAQITHAGIRSVERFSGLQPVIVSESVSQANNNGKVLTESDIKEIVRKFANAAHRAKEAGFDGVQIHSAHGYLLNQFLSPIYNKRTDEYGGNITNRARIHIEILQAVKSRVGEGYPVMIKMNCSDFAENGLTLPDSVHTAELLEQNGIAAVEISGGLSISKKLIPSRTGIDFAEKEAYFREEAIEFRKKIKIPIILVGGFRSYEVAEQIINENIADYISVCRPLISEPYLIKRWREGDRTKAYCKSCNLCFRPGLTGSGIYCVDKEREKKA